MARLNKTATDRSVSKTQRTHEGAPAAVHSPETQLKRLTAAHLLWESQFYIDGKSAADLVVDAARAVSPEYLANTAIVTREDMKLRHMPLLLTRELARHEGLDGNRSIVSRTLARVIQRPDELTEFVSLYWKDGKQPLSAQVKKGLAKAFQKFDAYQFAKYDRDTEIKLRDVLFLCHAKPGPKQSKELFEQIATRTLGSADTWETALSAGTEKKTQAEKKEVWTGKLKQKGKGSLGALALLKNLRNMQEAGVDRSEIRRAIVTAKAERVLPFRFISAAKYAPDFEPELETLMYKSLSQFQKLGGKTAFLIDVSGSMTWTLSGKSNLTKMDAAFALAIMLRELSDDCDLYVFGQTAAKVRPRRGFALRDEFMAYNVGHATNGWAALELANRDGYDRVIAISDEQWHGDVGYVGGVYRYQHSPYYFQYPSESTYNTKVRPLAGSRAYMLNVGSYENGIGYVGSWETITGFSENVVRYIEAVENV